MARDIARYESMEHVVGTDATLNIAIYTSAGAAQSVTGITEASWKLFKAVPRRRRKPFKGNAVLTKTKTGGGITLTAGNAAIAIADTDLGGKSGEYWHTLTLTNSAGDIVSYGQGPIYLRASA